MGEGREKRRAKEHESGGTKKKKKVIRTHDGTEKYLFSYGSDYYGKLLSCDLQLCPCVSFVYYVLDGESDSDLRGNSYGWMSNCQHRRLCPPGVTPRRDPTVTPVGRYLHEIRPGIYEPNCCRASKTRHL